MHYLSGTFNLSIFQSFFVIHCICSEQTCQAKIKDIEERQKAQQKEAAALDRRDNELLAEKKQLSELKGKKRTLEHKLNNKQERYF